MEWNKITVDNLDIDIHDNNTLFLEIDKKTCLNINVSENTKARLSIIASYDYDVNIKINNNGSLIINSINKDNNVKVNVTLMEKASINYNHSVLANMNSENSFNIYHVGNDSVSNLVNNGINKLDNKLFFTINGEVPKNLTNITCSQKSKIINYLHGNSKIIPNLIIDSNDIIANHAAYIGEIGEEEVFYMKSRGIEDSDIKKAIYKATMLGSMELLEEDSEFNKRINEWWWLIWIAKIFQC